MSLICKSCGSNALEKVGAFYICQYCGTKMISDAPAVASFDKSGRIEDLLRRADIYWRHGKRRQATTLYRQVLELDNTCEIAKRRLGGS